MSLVRVQPPPLHPMHRRVLVAFASLLVIGGVVSSTRSLAEETPATTPTATPLIASELLSVEEAAQHLTSEDALERERGLYELGMLKAKDHLPQVTAAIQDPQRDVRRAALTALRLMQGQDAVPELERLSKTSRRAEVREQAMHELEALRAAAALPTLIHAWRSDSNKEVRLAALEAMGAMGDASVVPFMLRALAARDARMRRSAAIALGSLGPQAKPAVPQLVQQLRRDDDENVRTDAAEALYKIGDTAAAPALLRALSDRADRVRAPAYRALDAWAQPGMETLLAPQLHRGRPHVRVYVAKLLSKIGTDTALAHLKVRLARETHPDVKPVLVEAVHAVEARPSNAP